MIDRLVSGVVNFFRLPFILNVRCQLPLLSNPSSMSSASTWLLNLIFEKSLFFCPTTHSVMYSFSSDLAQSSIELLSLGK
nr:MAG TPA: hypothetical protein [Caudoviricetes sp.]